MRRNRMAKGAHCKGGAIMRMIWEGWKEGRICCIVIIAQKVFVSAPGIGIWRYVSRDALIEGHR